MAGLPAHNTPRIWLDYSVAGKRHSAQFRVFDDSGVTAMVTALHAVITSCLSSFYNDVIFDGARVAVQGSNVTIPLPWVVLTGTHPSSMPAGAATVCLSKTGRDFTGHKVRFDFYGVYLEAGVPVDFRIDTEVDTLATNLMTAVANTFLANNGTTIGGGTPDFHSYVNACFNAYFQRRARR